MPEIPQDVAAKAGSIQEALNRDVQAHRSNGDLTPEARLRYLAIAYTRAEAQMTQLRESWGGASVETVESLSRKVFGAAASSGMDAISARDAGDRAAQIEDADEAMRLLRWADDNGDEVLARAVAQHAFNNRQHFFGGDWASVVDAYAETRPEVAEQIVQIANARRDTIRTNLSAMFIFAVHKPHELEALSAGRVRLLLESA